MRRDSPLALKQSITAEDLQDKPLILSRQAFQNQDFQTFFQCDKEKLNIVATYNLLFNGSIMSKKSWDMPFALTKLFILQTTAIYVLNQSNQN